MEPDCFISTCCGLVGGPLIGAMSVGLSREEALPGSNNYNEIQKYVSKVGSVAKVKYSTCLSKCPAGPTGNTRLNDM